MADSTAFAAWTVSSIWLATCLADTFAGNPTRDVVFVVLAMTVTAVLLYRNRGRVRFGLPQRLLLLPALAWAIFISYALLVGGLDTLEPEATAFLWRPFITYGGVASSLMVALMFGFLAALLMRREALLVTVAAAGCAAILSCLVQHSRYFWPYAEGIFLLAATSVATWGAMKCLLTHVGADRGE